MILLKQKYVIGLSLIIAVSIYFFIIFGIHLEKTNKNLIQIKIMKASQKELAFE